MEDVVRCPKCKSEYVYEVEGLYICPDCAHEWNVVEEVEVQPSQAVIKDAHGTPLQDGDSVTITKDIKVKGASLPLKSGTKVKNIRLVDEVNGHNIEAKVPGFGAMMLKSEIVKKST